MEKVSGSLEKQTASIFRDKMRRDKTWVIEKTMRRSWTMVKSEADLLNSQRSTRNKRLGPAVRPYSITEAYNSHSEHTKKGNAHGEDNGSLYYAPDESHLLASILTPLALKMAVPVLQTL
jgi:hypothetical protein